MISRPRIIITVSLLKPAKALSAGSRPVAITASMTPSATTSAGMRSQANSTTATLRIARQMAMSGVMRTRLPLAAATWSARAFWRARGQNPKVS